MAKYWKVLLALDFGTDNDPIIEKAKQIVEDDGAELFLIHVHEPVMTAYQAGNPAAPSTQVVSLDEELRKTEETRMKEVGDALGVAAGNRFVPFGRPSIEIKRIAEEQGIDLILIGTHGRSGIGLLLGSTANGVLHGCTCDVLAVRTKD